MKVTFKIEYGTAPGEALYVTGSLPALEGGKRMTCDSDGCHSMTIEISPAQGVFTYTYELRDNDSTTLRREWGKPHSLRLDARLSHCTVFDHWQDIPSNKPFFSEAFTHAIFRRNGGEHLSSTRAGIVEIRVDAPMIEPNQAIAVSGSCDYLGNWDPQKAVILNDASFPVWTLQIPADKLPKITEFKFLAVSKDGSNAPVWERHDNRALNISSLASGESMVLSGLFFENPLPLWHGTGTAIPVFSLRSDEGFGVGEFLDLKQLVDWAAITGQQFIQLLPVNDTTMSKTWTDSYPYTTNSTFALHPMYLRLENVGLLNDSRAQMQFDNLRKQLNELDSVDYERVNNAKTQYLRLIYEQQGQAEMTSGNFTRFARENDQWLLPYAAWSVLRDRFSTADMSSWGEYGTYNKELIDRFIESNRNDIDFYRFVQYHLDKQLKEVRDYAATRGVVLKGDIPIGISRCSVDAWLHPELFNLNQSAGAPPDDFATLGQNWGFPTYRWDVMARDGFAWWKSRLGKMAEYFSAYRIDHLLGFFRIWQVPCTQIHGMLGTFSPALPLNPQEMLDKYGFAFSEPLFTTPFITDENIAMNLGDLADEAKEKFMVRNSFGRYSFLPEFATQRDIANHFRSMEQTERNRRLCDGLLNLVDEVLFIEDSVEKGLYHPRIEAKKAVTYKILTEEQQHRFDNLYEDFFYHRHNEFWKESAMKKLPALIDSTGMLCCAEDLGMIPACVPQVTEQLKILSLEIQRMPKEAWVPFGNPAHYPYLSVCSTSSHDMSGIRQWWEEDYSRAQRFFTEMLHHDGDAPHEAEPEICREIILQNLESPSMLCILPIQDWLSVDGTLRRKDPREEQINVPADSHHYWRYRMHLTLGQLLGADDFNHRISQLVSVRKHG